MVARIALRTATASSPIGDVKEPIPADQRAIQRGRASAPPVRQTAGPLSGAAPGRQNPLQQTTGLPPKTLETSRSGDRPGHKAGMGRTVGRQHADGRGPGDEDAFR